MDRMKITDFPPAVLKLFDGYIHGMLDRRAFLDRAAKYAAGGFTAAAMIDIEKMYIIFCGGVTWSSGSGPQMGVQMRNAVSTNMACMK